MHGIYRVFSLLLVSFVFVNCQKELDYIGSLNEQYARS